MLSKLFNGLFSPPEKLTPAQHLAKARQRWAVERETEREKILKCFEKRAKIFGPYKLAIEELTHELPISKGFSYTINPAGAAVRFRNQTILIYVDGEAAGFVRMSVYTGDCQIADAKYSFTSPEKLIKVLAWLIAKIE